MSEAVQVLCSLNRGEQMTNPRVLIFDMDGVITNSEPIHVEAEQIACQRLCLQVPKWEWEKFKGKTTKDIAQCIFKKYDQSGKLLVEDFSKLKTEIYVELAENNLKLIEGVHEFILKFYTKKIMALNTSSNSISQRLVFDKFSLYDKFDFVVNGDEIPAGMGKPHKFSYNLAVQKVAGEYHDISAEDFLVIEDSDNGIISAKSAGCRVVGITTSFDKETLKKAGADWVVDNFYQLSQIIKIR
ncbi:HAD family hydrolase [Patescibacteria group bacterium]